jgi:hypothetical protein
MQMIWDSLLQLLKSCPLIDELGETFEELMFADPELVTTDRPLNTKRGHSAGPPVFRQRRQTTS